MRLTRQQMAEKYPDRYLGSSGRKEAFVRLEQLRKKGIVTNYQEELASYREEKYG